MLVLYKHVHVHIMEYIMKSLKIDKKHCNLRSLVKRSLQITQALHIVREYTEFHADLH